MRAQLYIQWGMQWRLGMQSLYFYNTRMESLQRILTSLSEGRLLVSEQLYHVQVLIICLSLSVCFSSFHVLSSNKKNVKWITIHWEIIMDVQACNACSHCSIYKCITYVVCIELFFFLCWLTFVIFKFHKTKISIILYFWKRSERKELFLFCVR